MNKLTKKDVTVDVVLYTAYTSSDKKHPVRVRVTWNRLPKYWPLKINGEKVFLTSDEWELMNSGNKEMKKIRVAREDEKSRAREAIKTATNEGKKTFTFENFEKEFVHQDSKKGIIAIWEKNLNDILQENRIGTFKAYRNALSAFKKFRNDSDVMPEDISVDLLKSFEAYLKKEKEVKGKGKDGEVKRRKGAGKTSVAMYMRALKATLNIAISKNPSLAEFYPFATKQSDKHKYKIKSGSGHKGEALAVEDIRKLISSQPIERSPEWEAKLYWLFSFYAQGMNFRDIFNLRYQNVSWDAIRYVRKKTEGTEASEEQIEVPFSEPLKNIIVKLGNDNKQPASYVFPILEGVKDLVKQDDIIRQKIKTTNKWLKELCKSIDIPPVTTYAARHSYASLLKESGESVEMIRELLGHSDVRTTEAYLKRFDLPKKQQVSDRLQAILKAS